MRRWILALGIASAGCGARSALRDDPSETQDSGPPDALDATTREAALDAPLPGDDDSQTRDAPFDTSVAPEASRDATGPDVATPADAAVPGAPRQLAPLSTSTVSSQRPTLRWVLGVGTSGAEVTLCRDRALSASCRTQRATGASLRVASALGPGVWFWRARGSDGVGASSEASAVWQFHVGARDAAVDTSWGSTFDPDGDGHADLAVSAINLGSELPDDHSTGVVRVFRGDGHGLSAAPYRELRDVGVTERFGRVVLSAGDLDGDGYGELAVATSSGTSRAGLRTGTVAIYRGGPAGVEPTAALVLEGSAAGELFGNSVAALGDVNGDGYGDLAVGAPDATASGLTNAGAALIYLGSASGLRATPYRVLAGATAREYQGYSVAGLGDVDGDGYAELAVGVSRGVDPDTGTYRPQAVFVYHGSASGLETDPRRVLESTHAGSLGRAVASAGDVNGDGYADLAAGEPRVDGGFMLVHLGGPAGIAPEPQLALQGTAGALLGGSPAAAGDFDGDGFGDLAFAVGRSNPGTGSVWVLLGSASGLSATPDHTLTANPPDDSFGAAVGCVGDLDEDGRAELAVGSPSATYAGGESMAGLVSVFRGGVGPAPWLALPGSFGFESFGSALAWGPRRGPRPWLALSCGLSLRQRG